MIKVWCKYTRVELQSPDGRRCCNRVPEFLSRGVFSVAVSARVVEGYLKHPERLILGNCVDSKERLA